MKPMWVNGLAMVICVMSWAGCSNLKPTPEQRADATAKPWTGEAAAPSYPMAESAAGLLNSLKWLETIQNSR